MRVLLVLTLIIGASCAAPRQSNRIVGGESTTIENYPFIAAILRNSWIGFQQYCGGTLVTSTAVVSAAHCYTAYMPSFLRVRLGSTFASSGGHVIPVSRYIIHQQYNSSRYVNDIAMVRLATAVVFSSQIQIARIAGPQYDLPDNARVNVAGWGHTTFKGRPSEILQHVAVNLINQQFCAERYAYLKTLPDMSHWPDVTPEMICSGVQHLGGKDACQGDSGGPVIHGGDILVGITSWGFQCAHALYPGVNVRVASYTNWISFYSVN